jgi:hypothetical protein
MRDCETSQAIDHDICAAVDRNHGLAVLVLERIRRVTQRFCEPGSVDVHKGYIHNRVEMSI